MKHKQLISLTISITISIQMIQQETLPFPWCYPQFLPLYLYFSSQTDFSTLSLFSLFLDPLPFASLPSFIASVLVLITIAVLLLARVSVIFFFTLSVSSPPYCGILTFGSCMYCSSYLMCIQCSRGQVRITSLMWM